MAGRGEAEVIIIGAIKEDIQKDDLAREQYREVDRIKYMPQIRVTVARHGGCFGLVVGMGLCG